MNLFTLFKTFWSTISRLTCHVEKAKRCCLKCLCPCVPLFSDCCLEDELFSHNDVGYFDCYFKNLKGNRPSSREEREKVRKRRQHLIFRTYYYLPPHIRDRVLKLFEIHDVNEEMKTNDEEIDRKNQMNEESEQKKHTENNKIFFQNTQERRRWHMLGYERSARPLKETASDLLSYSHHPMEQKMDKARKTPLSMKSDSELYKKSKKVDYNFCLWKSFKVYKHKKNIASGNRTAEEVFKDNRQKEFYKSEKNRRVQILDLQNKARDIKRTASDLLSQKTKSKTENSIMTKTKSAENVNYDHLNEKITGFLDWKTMPATSKEFVKESLDSEKLYYPRHRDAVQKININKFRKEQALKETQKITIKEQIKQNDSAFSVDETSKKREEKDKIKNKIKLFKRLFSYEEEERKSQLKELTDRMILKTNSLPNLQTPSTKSVLNIDDSLQKSDSSSISTDEEK